MSPVSRPIKFGILGFVGEGKPDDRRKSVRARTRTNNKLNPQVTPSPGIKPRPWPWEASPLTTVLSLLPATLQKEKWKFWTHNHR